MRNQDVLIAFISSRIEEIIGERLESIEDVYSYGKCIHANINGIDYGGLSIKIEWVEGG